VSKTVAVRQALRAYRQCNRYTCCRSLLLQNVPVLQWSQRNEARRLVTLIDTLYDMRCRLKCSAAGKPNQVLATNLSKNVAVHCLCSCLVTSFTDMWVAAHCEHRKLKHQNLHLCIPTYTLSSPCHFWLCSWLRLIHFMPALLLMHNRFCR